MRLTQEEIEAQKNRIIKYATKVFSEKGFAGTYMEDIAKACNISRSPLYYHFKNKYELFNAVFSIKCNTFYDFTMKVFSEKDKDIFECIRTHLKGINHEYHSWHRMRSDAESKIQGLEQSYDALLNFRKGVYSVKYNALLSAKEKGLLVPDCDIKLLTDYVFVVHFGITTDDSKWMREDNNDIFENIIDLFVDNIKGCYGIAH